MQDDALLDTNDWVQYVSLDNVEQKLSSAGELQIRYEALANSIRNLYKLSFVIRNQHSRQDTLTKAQRYVKRDPDTGIDLFGTYYYPFDYGHVIEQLRQMRWPRRELVQNQKDAATTVDPEYSYDGNVPETNIEPILGEEDRALGERLANATTSRRRQFAYWARHRQKLGMVPTQEDVTAQPRAGKQPPHEDQPTPQPDKASEVMRPNAEQGTTYSGTEVTGLHRESSNDLANFETQSNLSFASTVRDLEGQEAHLPDPPLNGLKGVDFECHYCHVLCPARDADRRRWR